MVTDVSGQLIDPVLKGQSVIKEPSFGPFDPSKWDG